MKPAHLTSEDEFRETLTTNLVSAFLAVKNAAKIIIQTGGSVVLISSAAARVGLMNHEAIAAAKAGVIGLVLSAAGTYAKDGIRFNVVAPGLVQTPMTRRITGSPAMEQASKGMRSLGRLGKTDDIANIIVWLLDPEHSWVAGQVFGVDEGLSAILPRVKS